LGNVNVLTDDGTAPK